MIVRKTWLRRIRKGRQWEWYRVRYEGWFLLGIIPLYIRRDLIDSNL